MFGIAYRMLGSATEAEDVVQDAYVRWDGAEPGAIAHPPAWLAKVVTNLCLNRLTSARATREEYIGPWLPEPVLTADHGVLGPLESAEQRDSVSFALLVLLERLSPTERAVFVLREAFGYGYREIAAIVELTDANCRQLYRRARSRLDAEGAGADRAEYDDARWRAFVERFLAAAREGDLGGLERMLADDVVSWADGGGRVGAARRPVFGASNVARYVAGLLGRFGVGVDIRFASVNGAPAVLGLVGDALIGVFAIDVLDGRITALRIMSNPDKLVFAAAQFAALSHSEGPAGS